MDFDAFVQEIKKSRKSVFGVEIYEQEKLAHSYGDTKQTRYPLYSVTKTILALAVGIACDMGLIDLGRSVLDYIPDEFTKDMSRSRRRPSGSLRFTG